MRKNPRKNGNDAILYTLTQFYLRTDIFIYKLIRTFLNIDFNHVFSVAYRLGFQKRQGKKKKKRIICALGRPTFFNVIKKRVITCSVVTEDVQIPGRSKEELNVSVDNTEYLNE